MANQQTCLCLLQLFLILTVETQTAPCTPQSASNSRGHMPHLKWKAKRSPSNTNAWWQLCVDHNSHSACRNNNSTCLIFNLSIAAPSEIIIVINNKTHHLLITRNNLRLSMLLGKCFRYSFNWISSISSHFRSAEKETWTNLKYELLQLLKR